MKNSSVWIAFISALSLHLILGGILLMNVDFSLPKEKPQTPIINASVVSQKMFDDLAQRKDDQKLAEKRAQDKARQEQERLKREKKQAEEKRKKIESDRIKDEKQKVLRKKREVERVQAEKALAAKQLKAKQVADKAKKLADAKAKKEKAERVQAEKLAQEKRKRIESERIQAAKVAKEKALKEANILAEKEAKRKADAEAERLRQNELDKQMAAEFEDSFSSAQSSKQLSEIARYTALIQNKISRNWQVEPDMKGKTCTLTIRLASDGFVRDVKQVSGDLKVCESAKRAVLKAKTLPIPDDAEIASQFRDFNIKLEPDF
ncbi:MAG: colicin import membrane protein [Psychromonas sp.]|jgi:colicin import membrane protein|uniref:cell envelope integrity protein TolA n=1 Tax=Psychromonas sp. TaxID=1884585 RepID=UPI0039E45795